MAIHYCTMFDRRYLTRGLAMLESLSSYLGAEDDIIVLVMDDATRQILNALEKSWKIVGVEDIGDAELLYLRSVRPWREYCWTCTPALAAWMVRDHRDGDLVVYLDADLYFYADPRILFEELGAGNILIHEHRFSPDKAELEKTSGRFNVGLVAFRVGDESRACVTRWRAQVIARCELDPERGYCGDQGYLNEWPAFYPGLRILRNIGGGVAPWNFRHYRIEKTGDRTTVDGQPLIFYHYHALQTLFEPRFGFIALRPSLGYNFRRRTMNLLYRSYGIRIRRVSQELAHRGFNVDGDKVCHLFDILVGFVLGRYVSVL